MTCFSLCILNDFHLPHTDQKQSETRALVAVAGFIHDVSSFVDEHPGGRHLVVKMIGRDATTAFFGGVYDHSNAAHNVSCNTCLCVSCRLTDLLVQLLAMMRVGVLHGGQPHGSEEIRVPPSQKLRIARYNEMGSPYASSTAHSDGEGMYM